MNQSSIDIARNECLFAIYNSIMNEEDKKAMLRNVDLFFKNYDLAIEKVIETHIETIDFKKTR